MEDSYDRKESWGKEHGGAPVKCILDVSKNIRYFFDLAMADKGLNGSQSRILAYLRLAEKEGRVVYQRDIEEIFRIKRSSVTSALQTLEKKGLLLRESIPEDARVKRLVLTQSAREVEEATYRTLGEIEKEVRSLFSKQEFEQFLDYMHRIDQKANELYSSKEEKDA